MVAVLALRSGPHRNPLAPQALKPATIDTMTNSAAALETGTEITLEVTGIAHGGVTIARHEGRVIFVHDTMPGETVRAELTEVKKNFARAVTTEVLQAAPERVPHIWNAASVDRKPKWRAGGAEFGHIELAAQRELKTRVLTDALQRQGKIAASEMPEFEVLPLAGDDEAGGLGWRTRVRLQVDRETGVVGPYAARSHRVVPVTDLPLAVPELLPLAPLGESMPDVTAVDLLAPNSADARMLLTYHGEAAPVGADDVVYETVFDSEFQVRAGGFWQVHTGAAERLYAEVAGATAALGERLDPSANNLDLYGGVGLLAAAFLDTAGERARIASIEAVESATDLAAENLSEFTGAQALTARTEDYLADLLRGSALTREKLRRATVVADPPRSGLGVKTVAQLLELQPANLIYVACDPVAFARDTQLLQTGGYTLVELRGLDMFPHTHHFETIGLFLRDN